MQVWGSYRLIEKIFRWLTVSLFAYIGAAFLAHPNWSAVLRGTFVPTLRFDSSYLSMLVAILGTTISPYLFFWQASQEVEEQKSKQNHHGGKVKSATSGELRNAAWDVNAGMLLSNVVMYFIILATAATLHEAGKTEIDTATQAAEASASDRRQCRVCADGAGLDRHRRAGGADPDRFGRLQRRGTCSTGNAVSTKNRTKRKGFYWVIAAATVVALLINFIGIKPMDVLFWTAVINGFLSPPMLVFVMLIANNRAVMKQRTNGPILNLLGGATTIAMTLAVVVLIVTWVTENSPLREAMHGFLSL